MVWMGGGGGASCDLVCVPLCMHDSVPHPTSHHTNHTPGHTFVLQVTYDGRSYRTRTVYNSQRPVWNEIFVFQENMSMLARR